MTVLWIWLVNFICEIERLRNLILTNKANYVCGLCNYNILDTKEGN